MTDTTEEGGEKEGGPTTDGAAAAHRSITVRSAVSSPLPGSHSQKFHPGFMTVQGFFTIRPFPGFGDLCSYFCLPLLTQLA